MEKLKIEHRLALQRGEDRDASRIQFLMMQMLEHIRSGNTEEMTENYNARIADLFLQLADRARNQSRLQSFYTTEGVKRILVEKHETQ